MLSLAGFWQLKPPPAQISKAAQIKWAQELSQRPAGAVLDTLDTLAKREGYPPDYADVLAEVDRRTHKLRVVKDALAAARRMLDAKEKPRNRINDEAEQIWMEACRGPIGPKYTPSFDRLTNDSACVISFEPAHHAHGIDWPATHTIVVYAPHASYELRQYGDALATDMRRRWKERGHTSKLRVELEARPAPAAKEAA